MSQLPALSIDNYNCGRWEEEKKKIPKSLKMKILFLCTAHNSLSQRLYLTLSPFHDITIEYALSDSLMITAAELAAPDLILCPFLTARVPRAIYEKYLTLIVHPGPPGDAGPSALDWVLIGDNGTKEDAVELLEALDNTECQGRTHWGVTVLQAIEAFDAGPVWAYEQFPVDIDQPGLTKSSLYRGPVSRAAISAVTTAIHRIEEAARAANAIVQPFPPDLQARESYKILSVSAQLPFQGGRTCERPLLKAAQRDFDPARHTAKQISRRIRCGDSQPGVLSKFFGVGLYVYGGLIDESVVIGKLAERSAPGSCVAIRNEAVCIATKDRKGIWITHTRRVKKATDHSLWPKVPAVTGLVELGLFNAVQVLELQNHPPADWSLAKAQTFQEVWVDFVGNVAYLYFDFYNGAMSTSQCSHLLEAMEFIIARAKMYKDSIKAVVLMGGAYFSNGIALNVIEAHANPSMESWANINRIDDVVHSLLNDFPAHSIITVAALMGNAAAGGVALAAACDVVVAGEQIVLNPAYRGVGLFGSEYHTLSYFGRCGQQKATEILQSMTPMSPNTARVIGLVDQVFPCHGADLDARIRKHVPSIIRLVRPGCGFSNWKTPRMFTSDSLARARAFELGEMAMDFFSARAQRYHSRRFNFVRKVKVEKTPLRFAKHRRFDALCLDDEEESGFDDVKGYEKIREQQILDQAGAMLAQKNSEKAASIVIETTAVKETMFSCYYKPVNEPLTPPLEPSQPIPVVEVPLVVT